MESSESVSKTRLKIAGAFGNDIRELFSVEIKPGQIVGAYNYRGSPRHFTKHDDGTLHEKSDRENRHAVGGRRSAAYRADRVRILGDVFIHCGEQR